LAVLVLAGVASHGLAGTEHALGTLETNEHRIIISMMDAHPVYTVYDRQGNLLERDLTRDQLFANFPDLERLVTEGVAKDASLERGNSKPESTREAPEHH